MGDRITDSLQTTYSIVTQRDALGLVEQKYIERPYTVRLKIIHFNRSVNTTEVLDEILNKGIPETAISCFARVDSSTYDVTINDLTIMGKFNEVASSLTTGENKYEAVEAPNIIWEKRPLWIPVTVFGIPFEIDDQVVLAKFTKYGNPEGVLQQSFKKYPYIKSGVRVLKMKSITRPIPNNIFIKGNRVSVKYEGSQPREKTCYICRGRGHLAAECPQFEAEPIDETIEARPSLDDTTVLKEIFEVAPITINKTKYAETIEARPSLDDTTVLKEIFEVAPITINKTKYAEDEDSLKQLEESFDRSYNQLIINMSGESEDIATRSTTNQITVCEGVEENERVECDLEEGELSDDDDDLMEMVKEVRKRTLSGKRKESERKKGKEKSKKGSKRN